MNPLFSLTGYQEDEDGNPITPGIKPAQIFAKSPNYGDTRLIPTSMMPRDTSFDSILAENEARLLDSGRGVEKAQQGAQTSFSGLMAKLLRGPSVRAEQSPAPVFDAAPSPVFHFDP